MQLLLFALSVVFVPLVHSHAANKTYPSFHVCDKDVVSKIKAHWENKGKPENVLQRLQANGLFTIAETSYDYHNSEHKSENECAYMTYADGVFNATFVPKNGSQSTFTYNMEESDDGLIKATLVNDSAPEFGLNWYIFYFDDGVVVGYVCGNVEGSKEPPITSLLVANNKKDSLTRPEINDVRDLIKGWGIKFKYNYPSECYLKE